MKNFMKEMAKTTILSAAATIGMFAGLAIWASGMGEWVEEQTTKVFSKKENEEV